MTKRDLLKLAKKAFARTEHDSLCPRVHGWRLDGEGRPMECICGVDELGARIDEAEKELGPVDIRFE